MLISTIVIIDNNPRVLCTPYSRGVNPRKAPLLFFLSQSWMNLVWGKLLNGIREVYLVSNISCVRRVLVKFFVYAAVFPVILFRDASLLTDLYF